MSEQSAAEGELEAPAEALGRARAAAREKGFRPGFKPRRRRREGDGAVGSGAGVGRRDPQLLGDEVEAFVAERGWKADVAVGALVGRWPSIAGEQVAQHCEPVDFTDGVLTLRTSSTAWATNLRLQISSIMASLEREVGEGTVREVRIVGPSAESWSRGALRVQDGRGPRDTYG